MFYMIGFVKDQECAHHTKQNFLATTGFVRCDGMLVAPYIDQKFQTSLIMVERVSHWSFWLAKYENIYQAKASKDQPTIT